MRRTIDRLCKDGISLRSRIQGVGVIDLIDGGDGIDVAQYSGSYADHRITKVSDANGVNTFRASLIFTAQIQPANDQNWSKQA